MRIVVLAILVSMFAAAAYPESESEGQLVDQEQPLASKIAVIPIRGDVDYGLQKSLERRVMEALESKNEVLIFEMDTWGGGLDPAVEIGDLIDNIKIETDGKVKTVAYVHKKAISAGALISLACQEIVMRRGTTIGDCQPIMISPQTRTIEPAPEKIETTVRTMMRKYAQSNGYPEVLCEAMVDVDLEVDKVTFPDGTVRYLTPRDLDQLSEDDKKGIEKKLVVAAGKLLTMHDKEAHEYDLSRGSFDSREEAIGFYSASGAEVTRYETNWSEELVRFLNSMVVASLLMTVGIIALYMAFKMPGFGAAEIVAMSCFVVLFLSKYLVGLAGMVEVVIFVVGIALLAVELFLIPGFGVVGIAGILCVLASLVLSLQKFTIPHYDFQVPILMRNLFMVFGSLLGATIVFMLAIQFMPRTPLLSRLVLAGSETAESGFVVASAGRRHLIGKTGIVTSDLRPSGRAEIDGETMIVVADGEFVERGLPVTVTDVRGNRVVVSRA